MRKLHLFFPIACICNSLGSTKADDSTCDDKCCDNDGTCKCTVGYSAIDCNTCDVGYYVSATVSNENSCTGIEKNFEMITKHTIFSISLHMQQPRLNKNRRYCLWQQVL